MKLFNKTKKRNRREPKMSGGNRPLTEKEKEVGEQEDKGRKIKPTKQVEAKSKPSEEGNWMEEISENCDKIRPHFWKTGSSTYSETEIANLGFLGWPINVPKVTGMTMNMTITNCHTILPKGSCPLKKKRVKSAPTPQLTVNEYTKL